MNNKKGLGKGLAALLSEAKSNYSSTLLEGKEFRYVDVDTIVPNKDQPRKLIAEEFLNELADSIAENGVLQPILLQKTADNNYRIIAGERRWRAAKIVGLSKIPAIIKNYDALQEFEVSLIENIQRQNLNPIEESEGYLRLTEEFGYTQEQISKALGKSRSHIANFLRLNSLPYSIRDKIIKKEITVGHAKVLIGLDNADVISEVIVSKDLNVRQTEAYVKTLFKRQQNKESTRSKKLTNDLNDPEMLKLSEYLTEKFGMKVSVKKDSAGGKLTIFFKDLDALDEILTKIG
jgi:ParB family chromosome partitioning protein